MKANELMIGDLVDVYHELPDESGFYKPLQATGVHNHDGVCFGHNVIECPWIDPEEFEAVEPIPLTPEILEKNGWKITGCKDAKYYFHDDVSFCIPLFGLNRNKGRDVSSTMMYIDDFFDSITIRIRYVHELQHALKLCRIEKEIKL